MSQRTLYNETYQHRSTAPSAYESLLGDSIERAFAIGIHDLEDLIQYLNKTGPTAPNGQAWTSDMYREVIRRLGGS